MQSVDSAEMTTEKGKSAVRKTSDSQPSKFPMAAKVGILTCLLAAPALALTAPAHAALVSAHSPASFPLQVSVAYADSRQATPNFPAPWAGSPGVKFIGTSYRPYDSGGIRLDNRTLKAVKVKNVKVELPRGSSSQTFELWTGKKGFTVRAFGMAILAQTKYIVGGQNEADTTNFDTSDYPFITSCTQPPAGPADRAPRITITLQDGSSQTFTDSGHILDTGGADTAKCHNESLEWRPVGSAADVKSPSGSVALHLLTNARNIASFGVNVTDAAHQPLPNVLVDLVVVSGPDAGKDWHANTHLQGSAVFVEHVHAGDVVQALVRNGSGGSLASNTVAL